MAELLIELFSEEIPARMQARAEADLADALTRHLAEARLAHGAVEAWSGPRRLGVAVHGLAERSEDVREVRKGPKVDAPEKALQGFLRGAGLDRLEAAEIIDDPKKGRIYAVTLETPGRPAADIVADVVPAIIRGFHWPKSMRWARGDLRWVRPLQRIVCVLDGKVVPFEVDGLASGNLTEGHRVHGRGPFAIQDLKTYRDRLEGEGHVRLDRADRRTAIAEAARGVCSQRGLELVDDPGLLDEVTGLAEWPQVILGDMDPAFLDLPEEVIRLSMRTHQKYFAVRHPETGRLVPHFVVVANLEAADGGAQIAAGNARVLSARLNDARFFWDNDLATPLDRMSAKLADVAFKAELGTLADKVDRTAALARALAPHVGADPDLAARAARLAKADLASGMVGEFPELQGIMGRYYAEAAGEPPEVCAAIAAHYKPMGPSDEVPTAPVSVAVALADKLDTLVGFWAIGETPTGSKDPFALRRAALGVVRTLIETGTRLRLSEVGAAAAGGLPGNVDWAAFGDDLMAFFADRLKQALRDRGQRHDLIDAVFALGEDDLVRTVRRVEALAAFLDSEDGTNLLAGYRRAANILRAEEKKDGRTFSGAPDPAYLQRAEPVERTLQDAILRAREDTSKALAQEAYGEAMAALAKLRGPVDAFFEAVLVNSDDPVVRQNRLLILSGIRDALHNVADVSRLEG